MILDRVVQGSAVLEKLEVHEGTRLDYHCKGQQGHTPIFYHDYIHTSAYPMIVPANENEVSETSQLNFLDFLFGLCLGLLGLSISLDLAVELNFLAVDVDFLSLLCDLLLLLLLVQSDGQGEPLDVELFRFSHYESMLCGMYAVPLTPHSGPQEFSIIQAFLPSMVSQPMILTAWSAENFWFLG